VEVQGSGEENVFTSEQMTSMLELSKTGIQQLVEKQREAIIAADKPSQDALTALGNAFKTS